MACFCQPYSNVSSFQSLLMPTMDHKLSVKPGVHKVTYDNDTDHFQVETKRLI